MPDSRRVATRAPGTSLVASGARLSPVVAAAQLLTNTGQVPASTRVGGYDLLEWQREAWDFHSALGEFNYGVEWFAQALSRVRLLAAEVSRAGDEPRPLETGPAVDLMANLGGGTARHAELMRSFAVQLAVPGDAYLVGREVSELEYLAGETFDAVPDDGGRVWTVQPRHTLRPSRRDGGAVVLGGRRRRETSLRRQTWELRVDDARWVSLPAESLICRVWQRDERLPWHATSPARAALPIMREIDMYNRHIVASLVSRVALNGFLFLPDEITLPTHPDYENSADPFMANLLDVMRAAIKNPGSAAAAAPLPLKVPGELIEKIRHLTFATPLDEKIWTARESAVKRLATTLNLPAEVLTGMGEVNHWGAWQLSEDAIKIHISPVVEIITTCLTRGYLHPMLVAGGGRPTTAAGNQIICWYDTSELTQRPDRSDMASQLNTRGVISDSALRRETGLDESDRPTDDELRTIMLRTLVLQGGSLAGAAYEKLTGEELAPAPPAAPLDQTPVTGAPPQPSGPAGGAGAESPREPTPPAPVTGPPDTRGEPPPPPRPVAVAGARGRAAR